ncbi:response regulator transcription factor [bacterium]|nr:response regulator transcription factor [bacterium]
MSSTRIVIIEDAKDILDGLQFSLGRYGYDVSGYRDGLEGLTAVLARPPDLLILDLLLPGKDGLDILKAIRTSQEARHIGVIILTSQNRETDKILGLALEADDYVTKPFSLPELEARIKTILRRLKPRLKAEEEEQIKIGPLMMDRRSYEVRLAGAAVTLTATEFRLLWALAVRPNWVRSREVLKQMAIPEDVYVDDHNIDVHVSTIRRKLEPYRKLIKTHNRLGYSFKPPEGGGDD